MTRAAPGLEGLGPSAGRTPYALRDLSYATSFDSPGKARVIRTLEWLTGKPRLVRAVRRFEATGVPRGQPFWRKALREMGIRIETPAEQIARIPRIGPVVLVANHPHGLVDGMVLAEIIGRVRKDYRILTRSILAGVDEIAQFTISVPFPHAENAQAENLLMRRRAMAHLVAGGLVALFPAGGVAVSERPFGPAIEGPWSPFTANLILRSRASVVPVRFPGANSRAYQIAHHLSPVLRQGLLLREVVAAFGKPQAPVIGEPIPFGELAGGAGDLRGLIATLRARTLAL